MRFVTPETVQLDLSDGHFIEVKKELTVGDEKRYRTAGFRRSAKEDRDGKLREEIDVDFTLMAFNRVETYLVDWSAKGPDGKRMKVSRAAIESLDTESFEEIDRAILKHIADTADQKKAKDSEPSPTATSSS